MNSSYVVIAPSGEKEPVLCNKVPLELAQSLVGGYVQVVPLFRKYLGQSCVVLCHEDGKMRGEPRNNRASLEWNKLVPNNTDELVGTVVVIMGPAAKEWG